MLGTLDVRGVQQESSDAAALRGYLQPLVGEPFLQARFSYGDELTLHFGQPRKPQSRELVTLEEGSFIVAARGSAWYFKTANGPTIIMATNAGRPPVVNGFAQLTTEVVESSQLAQRGARIIAADAGMAPTGATAAGFTCALLLSDGSSLLILPETESALDAEQAALEVADWEIFMTPHDRYLRVGPGPKWSYLPSRAMG
ncbi:MAG TPA: hypothetical protein VFI31_19500 [Pirellulales bacterium]|nr:hypothetical protein [Pirellulales bacterium]